MRAAIRFAIPVFLAATGFGALSADSRALADGGFSRMRLPQPPMPAFETSNGDRYGRYSGTSASALANQGDLAQFAQRIGVSNGHADFFHYHLDQEDSRSGPALVGTVSHGAAELQLRWTQ